MVTVKKNDDSANAIPCQLTLTQSWFVCGGWGYTTAYRGRLPKRDAPIFLNLQYTQNRQGKFFHSILKGCQNAL